VDRITVLMIVIGVAWLAAMIVFRRRPEGLRIPRGVLKDISQRSRTAGQLAYKQARSSGSDEDSAHDFAYAESMRAFSDDFATAATRYWTRHLSPSGVVQGNVETQIYASCKIALNSAISEYQEARLNDLTPDQAHSRAMECCLRSLELCMNDLSESTGAQRYWRLRSIASTVATLLGLAVFMAVRWSHNGRTFDLHFWITVILCALVLIPVLRAGLTRLLLKLPIG
jgi:hypothetical protein